MRDRIFCVPITDYKHNITCKGDFCYYQFNTGAITRRCYTVNDSLMERSLTVGLYQLFDMYVYLCDEGFCNDSLQQIHNISDSIGDINKISVSEN
ncbi:hypothetical protein PRIPAC_81433 [Pristionchus pacificus]|uniref:DUF7622 domain-containing protein n=1 Tax=Pristionchus pacificus TaxID=54126 RepID=A0A2A6CQF1_PRIPA|nr:hypothetical protein PRIPAC_81433 [Pristionchus pacificus]|eukprot:PDM80287.1 hypothetical protein PRIPAC_32866 [Pristionchus pacificus]